MIPWDEFWITLLQVFIGASVLLILVTLLIVATIYFMER